MPLKGKGAHCVGLTGVSMPAVHVDNVAAKFAPILSFLQLEDLLQVPIRNASVDVERKPRGANPDRVQFQDLAELRPLRRPKLFGGATSSPPLAGLAWRPYGMSERERLVRTIFDLRQII